MFIGTGTSITFDSGFLGELLSISPPNASREAIDVSHMGTSLNRAKLPSKLTNWNQLSGTMGYDPSEAPPMTSDAEAIVITFANSAATTWSFSGFMTGFDPTVELEDRAEADFTIEVTGGITIA